MNKQQIPTDLIFWDKKPLIRNGKVADNHWCTECFCCACETVQDERLCR